MEEQNDELVMKEMIKKVDKRKCKKLIAMCFNIKDCEILGFDEMLKEWAKQKLQLYKLFGNELKVEKEINISKENLKQMMEQLGQKSELDYYYENEFNIFKHNLYDLSPVIYHGFNDCFNWDVILKSVGDDVDSYILRSSYRELYFKNENEKMSFSTLMHKVFLSKDVDVEVSKFIQKANGNMQGKMYLSIDPFDYITMSMNKSNWTSCHSLHSTADNYVQVGCFSAGLFSYMCDNVSVIAYRADGEQYKYEMFNRSIMAESKNWRQMVFIHPEKKYFIASRQYPYDSEIIAKIIREMVEEKIDNCKEVEEDKDVKTNNIWKVSRKCYDNKKYIENNGFECVDIDEQEDKDISDLDFEVLHYNDMLHDFRYQFIYQNKYNKKDLPKIFIGSNPKCVICGERKLIQHDKPICYECEDKFHLDL